MIGKKLGNYRIDERVGVGGVGEVYAATDLLLQRPVAIKALRADLASQPAVLERFRAEARTLARLNHPNIATLYALLEQGDALFMVMEFVRGRTFSSLLKDSGPMPSGRALPLFFQALAGIGYAHDHGIVHRDVKGSNLMLNERGEVKVMDFGIARALGSSRVTRIGHMVGTLRYMSPEQIRGEETDARSDIYSLGVLLFDMLTGRVPFARRSDYELMRAHVELPPPSPRQFVPDLPEAVESAVLRALAKEPGDRFATTAEFRGAFDPVDLASLPTAAPARRGAAAPSPTRVLDEAQEPEDPTLDVAAEAPTRVATPVRRRGWRGAAALAGALLLLVGLNWLRVGGGGPVAAGTAAPEPSGRVAAGSGQVAAGSGQGAAGPAPVAELDASDKAALGSLGMPGARPPQPGARPPQAGVRTRAGSAAAPRRAGAGATSTGPRPAAAPRARAARPAPAAPADAETESGGTGWVIRRR